eukprot:CAMPEP_0197035656 /NCGR_PEP_ID=MMETSP1384-20130603/13390_1 /TAXON_ID=29189 /ORGANISM="Ammonia sp." /LENGTH=340 /DNA_ID=CAMNT_0042465743 /DNA_START=43 /DNA_END=1062 /DNA_ORIENTATION=+
MALKRKRGADGLDSEDDGNIPEPPKKRLRGSDEKAADEQSEFSGLDAHVFPNEKSQEIVTLNVGGIKYTTTIQTLTGFDGYLGARFSSKYAIMPSQDGTYFIDRDGELFKYVLEYLRTGRVFLPSTWDHQDLCRFLIEAEYYSIESLFHSVLLNFFHSKLIRHDVAKMKIVSKILSMCTDISIHNVRDWHKEYEFDAKAKNPEFGSLLSKVKRRLVIFELESDRTLFGMFVTPPDIDSGGHENNFEACIAFRCNRNSGRIQTCHAEKDEIEVDFMKMRLWREMEAERLIANNADISNWIGYDDYYPFFFVPSKKDIAVHIDSMTRFGYMGWDTIHRMEVW